MRHDNSDALLPWKAHIRGGWGRKIFSWKDIFQIDDEDDTNNRFNNLPRNATIRKKCVRCGKKDCEAASLITEQPKS